MNHRVSSTLATSARGHAFYCACKDRVSLRFDERWFGFERCELPGFRDCLVHLLNDPSLVSRLVGEALQEASDRGVVPASPPTLEDLAEMLGLVDAAMLVLEAQEIAGAVHG